MTTRREKSDFKDEVILDSMLDDAVAWIGRNLSPEQVFSESDLEAWAKENGWMKESEA